MSNYVFFQYSVSHVTVVIPFVLCCVLIFFLKYRLWQVFPICCNDTFSRFVEAKQNKVPLAKATKARDEVRYTYIDIYTGLYHSKCVKWQTLTKQIMTVPLTCFIFFPLSLGNNSISIPTNKLVIILHKILECMESWKHVHTRRFNKWTKSAKNRRMN